MECINPEFQKACDRKLLLLKLDLSDLFVTRTVIPLCYFQGLFAKRRFEKGEIICIYSGTVVRTREAMRMEDKTYLMRVGEQCYIDAKHHLDVLARSPLILAFQFISLYLFLTFFHQIH